ncbi:DNA polymerase/3'-5' exonuclease PolX [Candidatus Poribacteria bacterium]|nr:DNA polymerase/3'-5' exonuclease PolX [Candidatus Poribacteria bacterium]
MPIHNTDIADIFNKLANLLEIKEANQFRVRAYRNAASTISSLSKSAADMIEDSEDLTQLPGIGEDLAGKIEEIVKTGSLAQLTEIEKDVPANLDELMDIPGLGAKRARKLYEELGITSLDELKKAAESGKISEIEGFGQKTEENILEELKHGGEGEKRIQISVAEEYVIPLIDYLQDMDGVNQVEVAGSYRRRKETVGDLDILVTGDTHNRIIEYFIEYDEVDEVASKGETRSSIVLNSGIQVDLRAVSQGSYGAALLYFTGSKSHNVKLRNMAIDRDLKINEYGVFKDKERIVGKTEKEIYEILDLSYIDPELRENRDEVEASQKGELPDLVTLEDIRGDLQCHTKASDGHASLREMVEAAKEKGYEYLAITDHSPLVAVANGLDADGLAEQIDKIDELNSKINDFLILKSIEVDILEDGSLDLGDDILERLDLTICSIHSKFNLTEEKQTERIIKAMDNPNFNILAHPTGRRIGKRRPYEVNMERLMEAALERGCFLEVNAHPERLDLNDVYCKLAKEIGLKIPISTDAHRKDELENIKFGVWQARRGWLEKDDVLNTRNWGDLKNLLKRS